MLLASEAWVGVSRRLRTPPSTALAGGLRATRPRGKYHPPKKKKREAEKRRSEDESGRGGKRKKGGEGFKLRLERAPCD